MASLKMQFLRVIISLKLLCLICSGCSKVPSANDCQVQSEVFRRIDKEVHWNRKSHEEEQLCYLIYHLLESELTVDSAVQVALLNNPEIQATFEEIGIARADLVQAGLLRNPIIDGFVRFPTQNHASINTEFSIAQNFIDFLLIPLRKKIAEAELQQAQLRVANIVLNLAFDVQENYYSLQAEQVNLKLMRPLIDATEASNQLAEGQKEQGNINELEIQKHALEYLEAKVQFSRTQREVIRLREKLNKLLGLNSGETCWRVKEQLPVLPNDEVPLQCLETIALSQRLDLDVARWDVERIARMYGIKQWWTYTDAAMGISTEKDAEGIRTIGPAFSLQLPLFNYGQADRERIQSMFTQSLHRLSALEILVLSEVRSARDQLIMNRELVTQYLKDLLPLQQAITSSSQKYYNYMALSVYKLLDAKMQEIELQINYTHALRDYWISRVQLDRALGGTLHSALSNFEDCSK